MYTNEIIIVHNQEESKMLSFQKMYYHLFNAITDALREIEAHDGARAAEILIAAQQWGENTYMEMSEERNIK